MSISSVLLGLIGMVDEKGGVEAPTSACYPWATRSGGGEVSTAYALDANRRLSDHQPCYAFNKGCLTYGSLAIRPTWPIRQLIMVKSATNVLLYAKLLIFNDNGR